jgi:hypothetical protein
MTKRRIPGVDLRVYHVFPRVPHNSGNVQGKSMAHTVPLQVTFMAHQGALMRAHAFREFSGNIQGIFRPHSHQQALVERLWDEVLSAKHRPLLLSLPPLGPTEVPLGPLTGEGAPGAYAAHVWTCSPHPWPGLARAPASQIRIIF